MKKICNEDDKVDVYIKGGYPEEADISNKEYVLLLADNTKYYYTAKRGQTKAKDLRVMLRYFCSNDSVIMIKDVKYCEECYKKLKNVPNLSLI